MNRKKFIKTAGLVSAATVAGPMLLPKVSSLFAKTQAGTADNVCRWCSAAGISLKAIFNR